MDEITEELHLAGDQFRALVSGEPSRPHHGEHVRVEKLAGLVGDDAKQPFLQFALSQPQFLDVAADAGVFETAVRPILFVLCIRDVGDLTDVGIVLPHIA